MTLLDDLRDAASLLTRLPLGRAHAPPAARAVWAYPLVGLGIGAATGGICWAGRVAGLPPLLASFWALAGNLMLTGAMHEDGLADCADGLGGGATQERKLAIMRDSRIGAFGALALVLSLGIRAAALAALANPPACLLAAMVAAAAGRAGMAGVLARLPPARADGMGVALGAPDATASAIALALAAIAAFALLPPLPALAALVAATVATALVAWLASRQLGGHTGDVLGATEQVVECAVLTVLAAMLA